MNCETASCLGNPNPVYSDNMSNVDWSKSEAVLFYIGPERDMTNLEVLSLGLYSDSKDVLITYGNNKLGSYSLENLEGFIGVEEIFTSYNLGFVEYEKGISSSFDESVFYSGREMISNIINRDDVSVGSLPWVGNGDAICIFEDKESYRCKITEFESLGGGSIVGWSKNPDSFDWCFKENGVPEEHKESSARSGLFVLLDWLKAKTTD